LVDLSDEVNSFNTSVERTYLFLLSIEYCDSDNSMTIKKTAYKKIEISYLK